MKKCNECHEHQQTEKTGTAVRPVAIPRSPGPFRPESSHASEPFAVNREGNFVGQNGFVVPKNFGEFYESLKKRLRKNFTLSLSSTSFAL